MKSELEIASERGVSSVLALPTAPSVPSVEMIVPVSGESMLLEGNKDITGRVIEGAWMWIIRSNWSQYASDGSQDLINRIEGSTEDVQVLKATARTGISRDRQKYGGRFRDPEVLLSLDIDPLRESFFYQKSGKEKEYADEVDKLVNAIAENAGFFQEGESLRGNSPRFKHNYVRDKQKKVHGFMDIPHPSKPYIFHVVNRTTPGHRWLFVPVNIVVTITK